MLAKAKGAVTGAFSHDNRINQADEEGDSLTTILQTQDDRSALTILIADCTEVMRQNIVDIFDARQTGKETDMVAELKSDAAIVNPAIDLGTVNIAEQNRLKKELAQRDKDLSMPKMQELKDAALKHFDTWRTSVIQRVGEIVNSRQIAQGYQEQAKPKSVSPERAVSPMRFPDRPEYDVAIKEKMLSLYPPTENPLKSMPEAKRALILHSILLLLLSLEHYQAYSRTLLLHLTTSLGLDVSFLAQDESKIARGLLTAAESMKADDETKKKAEQNQDNRKWKVGLATVAGAALIGVTGGLAAPLLAAGVGTVMGGLGLGATAAAGYLGTLAGSTVLVGTLFGAYGGRMTGKMMDKYAREVEDFAFVQVRTYHKPRKIEKEFRRLRVAIGISGWLTSTDEVVEPWRVIGVGMESFALRYELETLMNLGNSMTTMVKSAAWSYAKSEVIKRTVFASLTAGLWPIGLLKISRIIDNPWSVANHRAQKAGEVLADALINKAQGERPVTLIGFSLGAKVIYTCLKNLAERRAFGLVDSVVMIGAPTPSTAADWRQIRAVCAGRVVNVYSANDYILAFLYRSSSIQFGVAGLQAVESVKGVENVDVSDMVSGHTSYRFLTGSILRKIGFEDVDAEAVQEEEQELESEVAEEEKAQKKSEEADQAEASYTAQLEKANFDITSVDSPENQKESDVSDQQLADLENEIERRNKQSYISWAQEKMIGAGASAAVAYEKAKMQWTLRRQGMGGQAVADVAREADNATKDANKGAQSAGINAPTVGDAAYAGMKAKIQSR